jgi:transcriptional regulator with GAF, ATPase, and Fis domain
MKSKEKDYFLALFEVAQTINSSLEMTKVLEEIVKAITETMNVKASSIRLLDSKKRVLMMGAAYGLSKGYIRKGQVIVKESGIDQKVMKGETVWIKDVRTDTNLQYSEGASAEGIKSMLVLPVKSGKNIIGVLRVYTDKVREFGIEEARFLEAVANLSGIAIENCKFHNLLKTDFDLMIAHKYRIDDN